MSKKKFKIKNVIGKTVQGDLVIHGDDVFKLVDTFGIPLFVILEYFKNNNFVVDWTNFCKKAMSVKWKKETVLGVIKEATDEIYGEKYSNVVTERLNGII